MENLFELSLNEQGKKYLFRLVFWTKAFYACCILTCIFDIINSYFSFKEYARYSDSYPSDFVRAQVFISTCFLAVYGVLLVIQSYFFYRFAKQSKRAIDYQSSADFSSSFNWLLKHCIIAAALFLVNTIWAMSSAYISYRMGR
jgi:hypothetical protein